MDIYTYRQDVLGSGGVDLTGYDVEATDGHIGKVDEASYEPSSSCLVVDTGFWIFGKKRMIPAGAVRKIDGESRIVRIGMSKDEIKRAPDYDDARHGDDERRYHDEVRAYYDSDAGADSRP